MAHKCNVWKDVATSLIDLNNFHSCKAVDQVSEEQLQVGENLN